MFKRSYSNKVSKKALIFFAISKFFYNSEIKFHKNLSSDQIFNNQLIELSSSSDIDNIIQEGEVTFKKNITVALPKVSQFIESGISKRQGDQRKNIFLEKENHKRENGFTINTQKYHIT